jgi:multidrug efflux pump
VTIDKGIAEMDRIARDVLDDTFTTALSGPSLDFKQSS